jgi:hypothetical protein
VALVPCSSVIGVALVPVDGPGNNDTYN